MQMRTTSSVALAAIALAATLNAGAQMGDHPAIGAWNGNGKAGNRLEIVVDDVSSDQTVNGSRCYWFSNKGMRANRLEDSLAHAVGDRIRWREGRFRVSFNAENARTAKWTSRTTAGPDSTTVRLRPMEKTRCTDRFKFDAQIPDDDTNIETAGANPIIGVWEGTWIGGTGRVGLIIDSVNEQGRARGRYCTRIVEDEGGKPGRKGQMTLWDIETQTFPGRADEQGNLTFSVGWWINDEHVKDTLTFRPDDGRLRLDYQTDGKPWRKATLFPGHHERGCVHRTTPNPAKRSRQYDQMAGHGR